MEDSDTATCELALWSLDQACPRMTPAARRLFLYAFAADRRRGERKSARACALANGEQPKTMIRRWWRGATALGLPGAHYSPRYLLAHAMLVRIVGLASDERPHSLADVAYFLGFGAPQALSRSVKLLTGCNALDYVANTTRGREVRKYVTHVMPLAPFLRRVRDANDGLTRGPIALASAS